MPKLNYKVCLAVSLLLFAFGYGFGFIAFPEMLRDMIKSEMHLGNDSKIRPFYEKAPVYIDFRIYLFNVTNKEEVIEGEKPELEEIGPYFFEEWKEKFNLYDDEDEDTLTYHYKNTYIFRPDLSGPGLNGNEIIVMPHPMIMGLLLATNIDKQPMLPMIENAIANLFNNPTDAFYTGRAMDMLFNGVPLDCHSKDDHITAAMCYKFKNEKSFKKVDSHHFTFSLFGGTNDTDLGEIKVYRGVKNYKDVGRVISVNGDTESNVWEDEECNQYIGTDTTIVPPLMLPEEGIWSFDPAVCRSMAATYTNVQTTYNDIPVYVYELDLSNESNAKKCFCRDENICPPKGTFDMYRCSGMPMLASLPHFYKAEQLLEGIESGLRPKKKDHGISVNLEILTGTALSAAKRMQFSLEVKPIPQVEIMKNMPEVVLPLFWVEESIYLDKDMTDHLKNSMFLMINIVDILKWLFTIVGAVGSIASATAIIMSRTSGSMSMTNPKSDAQF